jgi:hypothetical protein
MTGTVVAGDGVAGSQALSGIGKGDLYAVLVEPTASTEVLRGENGGRKLQHVSVVRSIRRVGRLQDLGAGPVRFELNAPKGSVANDLRVVVFAQLADQGAVVGAASVAANHELARH